MATLEVMANLPTLRISRRAADRLRSGHLWVYRSELELQQPNADIPAGALVTLTDSRSIPLGTALYSSASEIAARLVSRKPALTREEYLSDLRCRIAAALRLRTTLAPITADNNAHRLIFSEADDLPGIVADRYNDLVVVQLLTQGTAQDDLRSVLAAALEEELADTGPLTIWERSDPRIRELEQLALPPDQPLFSNAPDGSAPTLTKFRLTGLRFQYDAGAGQKTGAFLDQRLNYAAAAAVVRFSGRHQRALDVCTYQGGFALHLARVCEHVVGVDSSRTALEAADRNLELNVAQLHGREVEWLEADAFDYLRHLDETARKSAADEARFDAIVLDPPAFAKSKRAAESALRGYKELNLRAIRLLSAGGTLVTNSCSHHIARADFISIVAAAAADAGRRIQLLESRSAAPDHPEMLALPETSYLKCLICRVD